MFKISSRRRAKFFEKISSLKILSLTLINCKSKRDREEQLTGDYFKKLLCFRKNCLKFYQIHETCSVYFLEIEVVNSTFFTYFRIHTQFSRKRSFKSKKNCSFFSIYFLSRKLTPWPIAPRSRKHPVRYKA